MSQHARAIATHDTWRYRFATRIGTTRNLGELTDAELSQARRHFHIKALQADDDAWMWHTLCDAEIHRRTARRNRVRTPA